MNTLKEWLAHRARPAKTIVDTVVLHATGGRSLEGAIETLQQRGLSYHYLIEENGTITKCAPADSVAFHAGNSYGPHEAAAGVKTRQNKACEFTAKCSVNDYTIGIAFVNKNDGLDPYESRQQAAAEQLIRELKAVYPLRYVTTHAIVSPGRKDDPQGYPLRGLADRVGLEPWGLAG